MPLAALAQPPLRLAASEQAAESLRAWAALSAPASPAPVPQLQALVRGAPVELTKQEFDLLYLLAARPGVVFSRAALLHQVWSGDTYVTERTVDTVISRLRRKIERDPQDPEMLLTAWGVGYKFGASG